MAASTLLRRWACCKFSLPRLAHSESTTTATGHLHFSVIHRRILDVCSSLGTFMNMWLGPCSSTATYSSLGSSSYSASYGSSYSYNSSFYYSDFVLLLRAPIGCCTLLRSTSYKFSVCPPAMPLASAGPRLKPHLSSTSTGGSSSATRPSNSTYAAGNSLPNYYFTYCCW